MSILIVGNVLNDVYLNLDGRTEHFETDKNGTKWLDFSFDASEHHFFNRESNYGGAAVTLETLTKMGFKALINGSDLKSTPDGLLSPTVTDSNRYILVSEGGVSYLAPTTFKTTHFITPTDPYDYLYIDRSAEIDRESAKTIRAYLDISPSTELVIFIRNLNNRHLNSLIPKATYIFCENLSELSSTPAFEATPLKDFDTSKLIGISEDHLSYQEVSEKITIDRVDMLTHLSAYSIASATILAGFMLGLSPEENLRIARLNVENSKLNSTLSITELKTLSKSTSYSDNLDLIAKTLVLHPKGILAADESGGSIHKKFDQLQIPDTYENRRDYRNLFFTTPGLEEYVNGVILFDETARQIADNGQNFVDYLTGKRIIPGIKVDQGLEKFSDSTPANYNPDDKPAMPEETWTKGLDGLSERLKEYYVLGLRFAKWRSAFEIRLDEKGEIITPTETAITENCRILAEYARECQTAGIVPIVEPEVVYDGYYTIEQNATITSKILDTLFNELTNFNVKLESCILKVNMVLAGKKFETQSTPEEVGAKTANVLKNHVPAELAGVVFLSGGQTVEQATNNLEAVELNGPFPWPVTFSFARALQDPALYAWKGDNNNIEKAHEDFKARLIANTDALKKLAE